MIFFDNFLKQTSFSTRQGIFDFLLPCINSFINFYPLLTITKLDFTSSCLQHKSNGYLSYFLNTIHIEHSCRFGNSLEASTTINNYTHDIQWFLNIRKNLYLTEQKIFGFLQAPSQNKCKIFHWQYIYLYNSINQVNYAQKMLLILNQTISYQWKKLKISIYQVLSDSAEQWTLNIFRNKIRTNWVKSQTNYYEWPIILEMDN